MIKILELTKKQIGKKIRAVDYEKTLRYVLESSEKKYEEHNWRANIRFKKLWSINEFKTIWESVENCVYSCAFIK